MKRLLVLILLGSASLFAANELSMASLKQEKIAIENRILLKLGGKAITVMDLVRKMDMVFYRQFPHLASSEGARCQFYTINWPSILQMVIDEELILADAEEKEVPITDGEVRQEMERLFGPQVVLNLDKVNLSFDEAFKLIKRELIVQKMTGAFVRAKAMADVHPADVRVAYEKLLQQPIPENSFNYQYITVRGEDEAECKRVADEIVNRFKEEELESLLASQSKNKRVRIVLSEPYERKEEDISLVHLKILKGLSDGEASVPVVEKSRTDRLYYRIYILNQFKPGAHPSFNEIARSLKQQLLEEAMVVHNDAYRKKLRAHYDITEKYLADSIPKELKPFALR